MARNIAILQIQFLANSSDLDASSCLKNLLSLHHNVAPVCPVARVTSLEPVMAPPADTTKHAPGAVVLDPGTRPSTGHG
jgi:hypothetical protein